jgi:chromosome partitioning protein
MKTIAINSTKGGTGKSTLSILFINALTRAGYKCLAIDTDMINHSLSFYFNKNIPIETMLKKNIFKVFTGETIRDNILPITEHIDLLHADVRLLDFRNIDTNKRLKKAMDTLDYDYIIIDTAPTYDNIIKNVLMASDILIIPINPDIFNHQTVKYQLEKLADLEITTLDVQIVFNQYDQPRTDNEEAYSNQIINIFMKDTMIGPFVNACHISKSNIIKKYINDQNYHLNNRGETVKIYNEVVQLIQNITNITIEGEI